MKKILLAGLLALMVVLPAHADWGRHDGDDRRAREVETQRRLESQRQALLRVQIAEQAAIIRAEQERLDQEHHRHGYHQTWNPIEPVHLAPWGR
ncbi:MAG TPA: hypothetical protein VGO93_09260 [Candidatus Xenobia bacterium]